MTLSHAIYIIDEGDVELRNANSSILTSRKTIFEKQPLSGTLP